MYDPDKCEVTQALERLQPHELSDEGLIQVAASCFDQLRGDRVIMAVITYSDGTVTTIDYASLDAENAAILQDQTTPSRGPAK
jgi:hypothetical protein